MEVELQLPFDDHAEFERTRNEPFVDLVCGDVIETLKAMDPESVHCVVTSPPYYGLRTYGIEPRTWDDGLQCVLGDEPTLEQYTAHLVDVFRHVKRVLHPHGSMWLNLGDSYASGGRHDEPKKYPGAPKPIRPKQKMSGKNLLMVPARAALALQSPYYTGQIKRETDRAWFGALIDGEGCITILQTTAEGWDGNSYPGVVAVNMCDRELVDHAASICGGNVNGPYESAGVRPAFKWRRTGMSAANLIAEIYPHLMIKRKQAIILWNHEHARLTGGPKGKGHKTTQESWEKQAACRKMIQALNACESVDIPTWMKEPIQPYEPGWILRQDQIWAKALSFCPTYSGSVMPESTRDRTTWAHEHVFHFQLSENAFYDQDGYREPYAASTRKEAEKAYTGQATKDYRAAGAQDPSETKRRVLAAVAEGSGRNLRNVWVIPKQNFPGAHFATFPEKLVEPIIKLATSEKGACDSCGAQIQRKTIKEAVPDHVKAQFEAARAQTRSETGRTDGHTSKRPNYRRKTLREDWEPACECNTGTAPAVVMDIFSGSGRAGIVARRLGRSFVGIDANPDYIAIADKAIRGTHVG